MGNLGNLLPKIYRKIALGFLGLAIIGLAAIILLVVAGATIIINPSPEKINQDFIFDIVAKEAIPLDADAKVVEGKVLLLDMDGSKSFASTGSKAKENNSDVVGEVTIINNSTKDQPLVATTRLAASADPTKVLVRLKNNVTVLAGKTVKVQVYPDNVNNFKDLKPMKFIIPGLNKQLQEKIYAQNEQTLSQAGTTVSVVADKDLADAEKGLKDQIYQKVLDEASKDLDQQQTIWPKMISLKVKEFQPGVKAGDEVAEFTATMKLQANVIIFDENQFIDLAKNQLTATMPVGKQLLNIDPTTINYSVQNFDPANKKATIKATFAGNSVISSNSDIFDKSKLVGLNEDQIKEYFSQFPGIRSVEIKFYPGWMRKAPRLQSKINIEIAQ